MSSDRNRVRYFIEKASPNYKAPLNQVYNVGRIYTPQDTRSSRRTAIRRTRSSAWTFARKLWCSATLKSKRDAIFQCSSSTVYFQLRLHREPHNRQRCWLLYGCRAQLERRKARRDCQGVPTLPRVARTEVNATFGRRLPRAPSGKLLVLGGARVARSVEVSRGAAIRVREKACPNLLAHKAGSRV
jgi:hypothetical protein